MSRSQDPLGHLSTGDCWTIPPRWDRSNDWVFSESQEKLISPLTSLVAGIWGEKYLCIQGVRNDLKMLEEPVPTKIKKQSLYVVFVIHFHLLLWPKKLNGENEATEILTLQVNCVFVFLLLHSKISHHWYSSYQWVHYIFFYISLIHL